jgi:hypothetical protein
MHYHRIQNPPDRIPGIGMKKWSIEKLAKDITTLIGHWQTDSTLGQVLQLMYESFQMEVGLDGNILTRSYQRFGDLASHSWFKVLWQYSSLYKVKIEFNPTYLLGPTHHGDKPLIQLQRCGPGTPQQSSEVSLCPLSGRHSLCGWIQRGPCNLLDHPCTAPHKYRNRRRDSASLGGSPGYQRYQKISRMRGTSAKASFYRPQSLPCFAVKRP